MEREGESPMKQIRIERKIHRSREDRYEVLPLDPRDPDILRAKGSLSRPSPRGWQAGRA